MKIHNRLAVLAAFLGIVSMPGVARADPTCSSLLPAKFDYLTQNGGYYDIEVTVTKDSLSYVTYSSGWIELNGSWLYGPASLQFSDRFNGSQNFSILARENSHVWIGRTGIVWIYNDNYSSWIVSNQDMSCAANLIYKYVPGVGMVTIAIRRWGIIW